jgi:UDP-N-acetylglucosamine 2-epimerase
MRMPEEQNRILTDHLSTWLFCPTDTAVKNLGREGITNGVHQVGDIMYDATLYYQNVLLNEEKQGLNRLENIGLKKIPQQFLLATIHRADNTDDATRLAQIVEALSEVPFEVILPLHPRTRKKLAEAGLILKHNAHVIEPIGYLEMLALEMKAKAIITDSGGVQKEACFMQKPCITLREETEWVETVEKGWNTLTGPDKNKILRAVNKLNTPNDTINLYGNGKTGVNVLEILFNESLS